MMIDEEECSPDLLSVARKAWDWRLGRKIVLAEHQKAFIYSCNATTCQPLDLQRNVVLQGSNIFRKDNGDAENFLADAKSLRHCIHWIITRVFWIARSEPSGFTPCRFMGWHSFYWPDCIQYILPPGVRAGKRSAQ